MSNSVTTENQNDCVNNPCDNIELIINTRLRDIGDFSVRRVLPVIKRKMVGPWIFFDHMGPVDFPAGKGISVRPHPHINLATVTYLFDGEIWHRDSLGNSQAIKPGDINLMVAGKGITHSERTSEELINSPRTLHGLQLWHALPEEFEEVDPAFYHYPSSDIPTTVINDVPIRVMIGSAYDLTSPVKTFTETLYLEMRLKKGQSIELPHAEERAIYMANGSVEVSGTTVNEYDMAVLKPNKTITITGKEEAYIALIGGKTLGKRNIFWNFVSSRPERIEQAKEDWQQGRFPKVIGDEEDFIPLP